MRSARKEEGKDVKYKVDSKKEKRKKSKVQRVDWIITRIVRQALIFSSKMWRDEAESDSFTLYY